MVELGVIRDLVAIFGVIAGFSYYVLTVRATKRNQQQQLETRQAQLFMQICNRNYDPEHNEMLFTVLGWEWDDWDDFGTKYRSNMSEYKKYASIVSWYESLGVLVKNELVSPVLVSQILSSGIIMFWEKYGHLLKESRVKINDPKIAKHTEFLYNQMKEIIENTNR